MDTHTKEKDGIADTPLSTQSTGEFVGVPNWMGLVSLYAGANKRKAIADRIVACWNACIGLPDPNALREERDELVQDRDHWHQEATTQLDFLRTTRDGAVDQRDKLRKVLETLKDNIDDVYQQSESLGSWMVTQRRMIVQALAPVPAKVPGGEEGKDGAKVPALPL